LAACRGCRVDDPNLQILYWTPLWLLAVALLLGLLLAAEGGFRMGRGVRERQEQQAGTLVGTTLGGVLGLLALLLAFTYSIAIMRTEQRKQAVVAEANALGTAYLRAACLAEPTRSQLRSLLRDYTDTRILAQDGAHSPSEIRAAIAESERIQAKLWPTAARGMANRPPTLVDSLMLASLNNVIDMHTTRLAAGRDRLPEIIVLMLFGVGAIALWLTGYAMGLASHRHVFLTTTLAILCASVTVVILDLDRPRGGLVRVSQQSLIDARRAMDEEVPATATMGAALLP